MTTSSLHPDPDDQAGRSEKRALLDRLSEGCICHPRRWSGSDGARSMSPVRRPPPSCAQLRTVLAVLAAYVAIVLAVLAIW